MTEEYYDSENINPDDTEGDSNDGPDEEYPETLNANQDKLADSISDAIEKHMRAKKLSLADLVGCIELINFNLMSNSFVPCEHLPEGSAQDELLEELVTVVAAYKDDISYSLIDLVGVLSAVKSEFVQGMFDQRDVDFIVENKDQIENVIKERMKDDSEVEPEPWTDKDILGNVDQDDDGNEIIN